MMPKPDFHIDIYHLDDEPDTVDWIPEALYIHFRSRYPEWMRGNQASLASSAEEDQQTQEDGEMVSCTFQIATPECLIEVRYRIFGNSDLLEPEFTPRATDIVLLDLITELPNGKLETSGLKYCVDACKKMGSTDRVYILSGFPNTLRKQQDLTNFPDSHVIIKPPAASDLVTMLAQHILDLRIKNPVSENQLETGS